MNKKIFVTEPFLPPLKEFNVYLKQIWKNKLITNNGPFHKQLEQELCNYLGVKHISLFANGTIALLVAIKALELTGEVITTPYSFVATVHSIKWNGLEPVFVDIDPKYYNLDPSKIEEAITDKTTAILPVHVYGNPCETKKIKHIAEKYNLKVIYDAAHAFGVKKDGKSILNEGDLSILSFHATKVFNTFEGGAIISHTTKMKQRIDDLKNFGFHDELMVEGIGINGKMNELQASMGLLQLKYINEVIDKRKKITNLYRSELKNIKGISFLDDMKDVNHNYAYFPIFINERKFGRSREEIYEKLKNHNIYSRRYFYPLISQFTAYKDLSSSKPANLPMAEKSSEEVICLPVYPDLTKSEQNYIIDILIEEVG
jgi:dTDP-4-amino-4,6-dideoxygalactose transaminase